MSDPTSRHVLERLNRAESDPRGRRALTIGRAWRDIRRLDVRRQVAGEGLEGQPPLEGGEVDTLDVLGQEAPLRMHELAASLHIDPSTATRAVDRLVKRGLAERVRCDDDARFVEVTLTPAGERVHDVQLERRLDILREVLGQFTDDEKDLLGELMPRFATAVAEASERTVTA